MTEPRRFTGDTLVIATHNRHKAEEILALLGPHGVARCVTAGELGLPEPEETEATFTGNAVLKARAAALASGLPALADDSGLAVAALNGAPGIYSARWGGPDKDFAAAMARVQSEIGGNPDRSAAFVCALALAWPDGHAETVEGRIEGTIAPVPRGANGFGYDPIFVPIGLNRTFAELTAKEKQAISHRAMAFQHMIAHSFERAKF
jgi:XTP/dITP diphosphohydrolase